jgi:hypothetical protein
MCQIAELVLLGSHALLYTLIHNCSSDSVLEGLAFGGVMRLVAAGLVILTKFVRSAWASVYRFDLGCQEMKSAAHHVNCKVKLISAEDRLI